MNKKIKVFILSSLLLNVLFIGLFCGFAIKHHGHEGTEPIKAILSKADIPEERRSFLEAQLHSIFDKGHEPRKEMEKMREDTFKILSAETFDEEAYQAQVDKVFDARSQDRKNINDAIKNLAKQLNAKERLALAEVLRDMPRKH